VDGEMNTYHPRDFADIVVHRVALGDAPGCVRMANPGRVMECHDRLETGQAGRHHLRTAAETGKEMRLDESGGDADVCLKEFAVQVHRDARGRAPDERERGCVAAVVIDDPTGGEDVASEHSLELGVG